MNKKNIYWKLGYLVATGAIFLLDQATKAWAVRKLRFGGDMEVIPDFFNFAYATNKGDSAQVGMGKIDVAKRFLCFFSLAVPHKICAG